MALKGGVDMRKELKATKYKAKPKATPKTKEQLRQEVIDNAVTKDPSLTQHEGNTVEWFNKDTGKITDYKKAEEGLKSAGVKIGKVLDAKLSAEAAASEVTTGLGNFFGGKNNPFSKNFKWNMNNRELAPGPIDNKRVAAYLALENPHIMHELNRRGFVVPKTPDYGFYTVPDRLLTMKRNIPTTKALPGYRVVSRKKGGKIIKAQSGIKTFSTILDNPIYTNRIEPVTITGVRTKNVTPTATKSSSIVKEAYSPITKESDKTALNSWINSGVKNDIVYDRKVVDVPDTYYGHGGTK